MDSERENVESVVLACRALGAELTAEERRFVVGHSWNEIHAVLAANHRPLLSHVSMDELINEAGVIPQEKTRQIFDVREPISIETKLAGR